MTIMTTTGSFGSISFRVLIAGRSRARQAKVRVVDIPWANESIVQIGGRGIRTARLNLFIESTATLNALEQAVASQATLTYYEYSGQATLGPIDSSEWMNHGNQVVTATFYLDSD